MILWTANTNNDIISMNGFTGHESCYEIPVHRFATTREAGEMLGISRQAVLTAIKRGKLRYLKTARQYMTPVEDVLDYKRVLNE